MAAYVAIRAHRRRPAAGRGARWPPAPTVDRRALAATEAWVLDTSPPGQRDLELRWRASGGWSQLWFFVLDPESWR